MNRRIHKFLKLFIIILLIIPSIAVFAQEEDQKEPDLPMEQTGRPDMYALGDQMLSVNAGFFWPMFFRDNDWNFSETNLSIGGVGSLNWNSYLNNNFALGLELAGSFNFSPNMNTLLMVPFTAKASYYFRFYPFELPIHLGAGMNLTKYRDELYFGPIVKPGFSGYWYYSSEWAFGFNVTYWWVPQTYGDHRADQSRYGSFLETSLSAMYHF
ncbi:MAG: hypothetical protein K9L68_03465 [Spirochaetales bacterium]|nr:hypothetical protein [Spirochaetales bacterium]